MNNRARESSERVSNQFGMKVEGSVTVHDIKASQLGASEHVGIRRSSSNTSVNQPAQLFASPRRLVRCSPLHLLALCSLPVPPSLPVFLPSGRP